MGSHPANLALRFLLELAALVGLGMWGWSMTDGWFKVVLAVAMPVVGAALWGTFAVPEPIGQCTGTDPRVGSIDTRVGGAESW